MITCEISDGDREYYGLDKLENLTTTEDFEAHLEKLLRSGAAVIWDREGKPILGFAKALVEKFNGLRIEIRANEHHPPHFHVVGSGVDASFAIDDCRWLIGTIGRRQRDLVEVWFQEAKPDLIRVWNATRPSNCQVGPIG